ncbi:MAG: metallophosphoesterase family protein [Isosphaeraceae bacterium]|nr:metallophosphoesterase family protein [Isosphaeraceae bacterium]
MDGIRRTIALALLLGALPACSPRRPVESLPDARTTLADVGRRLSRSHSLDDLAVLASRGDRLLAALTRAERDALARGYFRFRIDRDAEVTVAAPGASVPFWLKDQVFERAPGVLHGPGGDWPTYRRTFHAGWVGLGVNGLDRRPAAHYVVFVRGVDGTSVAVTGLDQQPWEAVVAQEGVSATSDGERALRGFPPTLLGTALLHPAHDQRHATLLATGKVWKTHVVSRPQPDQVVVSFGQDPRSALSFGWRTDASVTKTALRIGPAPNPATARVVPGDSRVLATPSVLNDPVTRRHRVDVDGLRPGTAYSYALGDGSAGGWTAWHTVRTAPSHPDRYTLLYLGDAQCGLEGWGKLLEAAHRRHPDAGAILLAGDLVDRGNERTNWDHFFLRAQGVFESVPFMPCAGNHEYLDRGPLLYRSFFRLPANGPEGIARGLVYSFEYADAFIAVLDSTAAVSDASSARLQADWLDAALTRTRATWKLVMFHHPLYASHPSREYPKLRDAWVPLFDKHHVDLVLQGHDHAYLRTYPMRADERVDSAADGTTYLVSVSGEKFVDQTPRDYGAVGFTNVATYQTIDVEGAGKRLTYRAWDREGRQRDSFVIEKAQRPARLARQDRPSR